METFDKDWKLKLRYGKLITPFQHYTIIAEGLMTDEIKESKFTKGKGFMGMKIWASSNEESTDVFQSVGIQIGFKITGNILVYKSDPLEPPRESPYAYDINFSRFSS